MLSVDKKFFLRSFLIMAGINIGVYLVYHLSYHLGQYWFDLLADYVMDAWDCLLPAISAFLMLFVYSRRGAGSALIYALIISLARLFYTIPFYYLYFMTSVTAPSSLDSITTSLLSSALVYVTFYLHIFALWGIGVLIYRHKSQNGKPELYQMLSERGMFNFEAGSTVIIFVISLVQFLYALRVPVIATADYFAEYGLNTRVGDLIHMLFNYLFVIFMLVLCHVILCKLKDRLTEGDGTREETE